MSSKVIKHHVPNHPYIFNIVSWEKYYRKDLQHMFKRVLAYVKLNHIESLFKHIDYTTFIEYIFDCSYKKKPSRFPQELHLEI